LLGSGRGWDAKWSRAAAKAFASRPYIGGELRSFWHESGGYRSELAFNEDCLVGGELGGVISDGEGMGPGGQKGRCLLGTGVDDRGILRIRDGANGGGVGWRSCGCWCWITTVAMVLATELCERANTTEIGAKAQEAILYKFDPTVSGVVVQIMKCVEPVG
jgi:hypothetical protein